MRAIARTLPEAYRYRATAVGLLLPSNPDLACNNLMCEHVSKGCACRLSQVVERMPGLEEVDVSHNALPQLPASLFSHLPHLRVLNAASNALHTLPATLADCPSLEELDLRGNAFLTLPLDTLAALPKLKTLLVQGNPLTPAALASLQASRFHTSLE